jgi:DNA-binding transcriptional MerR regulator
MSKSFLVDEIQSCRQDRRSSQLEVKDFFQMDIAEVAKRSGLPASTLRYYEEKGLIKSVGRDGLRRRFAPGVVDQLALVALGQAAGFSLDEIRSMFAPDGRPSIDRRMLAAKAADLDATIKRLKAMSNGLKHAAVCPARSHAECPSFQKLVKAAASGALAGARKR